MALENYVAVSHTVKHTLTVLCNNPGYRYLPRINKNVCAKKKPVGEYYS